MPTIRHQKEKKITSVTLELTIDEAQRLALAQEAGLLTVLLKPAGQDESVEASDVRLSELDLDVDTPARPRYREIRGQEIFGHQPLPVLQAVGKEGRTASRHSVGR